METTFNINEMMSVLTSDEKQLLKDTINEGFWGSCDYELVDDDGEIETVPVLGYCTNDANLAGNFSGHRVSAMFRSIYKKLCPEHSNQIGRYISHCNDWWGNGSGDMLFIRMSIVKEFEDWAREIIREGKPPKKNKSIKNDNQKHIYRVLFRENPFEGESKKDFFFSSLSAIYEIFSPEQIGCKLSRLFNLKISSGVTYIGKKCLISKEPVHKKSQINPKNLKF